MKREHDDRLAAGKGKEEKEEKGKREESREGRKKGRAMDGRKARKGEGRERNGLRRRGGIGKGVEERKKKKIGKDKG